YRCHPFVRARPFLAATLRDTFDLAIIVGPSREPVLRHALATLTRRAAAPPILVLLAHAVEADMIDLLDAGVDDCLSEPAGEDWLLARTRALLRRARTTQPHDAALTHFDGYRFDPVRCRVETPDATITLTPKELALALLLFRNQGRDLSRQYLVDGVWARESGPSSRSLDTHISRVRQKLSLHAEHGYQLSAIYSHGYRLDRAPAKAVAAPPPAAASCARPRPGPPAVGPIALCLAPSRSPLPAFPLARLFAHGVPAPEVAAHDASTHDGAAHDGAAHDGAAHGETAHAACIVPADAARSDPPPPPPG
ncbi:MAG: winged helix-turn-helix transcriptional regulator, partial [Janthinobacterium lividum]